MCPLGTMYYYGLFLVTSNMFGNMSPAISALTELWSESLMHVPQIVIHVVVMEKLDLKKTKATFS